MTIAGLPALAPSTPRREAARAAVTGALAGLGAVVWTLGEAASAAPPGPLGAFAAPTPAVAPLAWSLDHRAWHGVAGWPSRLAAVSPLPRIIGIALIALAALMVLHPGAFKRPFPYYLSPLRRAIAWASAILIGLAAPAAVLSLSNALAPDLVDRLTMDAGAALRLGIGIALFCAFAWTMAGPGILNVRAALRFSHGALAGISVFGALALAVLLAAPLTDLAQLASVGNVMVAVDLGRGTPGGTYGFTVCGLLLVYGFAVFLAGALATSSAPQSMGIAPRTGSAGVAAIGFVALLLAGRHVGDGVRDRIALAAPDVARIAQADAAPRQRPIVLLMGDRFGRRRVPPRQALSPVAIAPDCAPATLAGGADAPPASEANLAAIAATLARRGTEISGTSARLLGCEVAIRARLFDPDGARALVLDDSAPARTGFFAFSWVVRGLLERPAGAAARRRLAQLMDTTRYAMTPEAAARIRRALALPAEAGGTITGRLDVDRPGSWRVALAAGDSAPEAGVVPWLYAPRTDGQVLQYVAQATAPDLKGTFTFADVPAGAWQLALLAPEGTNPETLAALSIRGDPGQFIVRAAARRDLGTIRIRP